MPRLFAFLALGLALAGCGQPTYEPQPCHQPIEDTRAEQAGGRLFYAREGLVRHFDPNQPWDVLVLIRNATGPLLEADLEDPPAGWTVAANAMTSTPSNLLLRFRLQPQPTTEARINITWRLADSGPCLGPQEFRHELLSGGRQTSAGKVADAGQGVHAYVSFFLDNGDLALTNNADMRDSPWPQAPDFEFDSEGAKPYYLYDNNPQEQPPYWKAPPGVASDFGYETAPPALNAAMKGLSTNSIRVVGIPASEGFPVGHLLHGKPVVAIVQIRDVQDLPCPDWQIECQAP